MKITLPNKTVLLNQLTPLMSVVEKKSINPVTQAVLVRKEGDYLEVLGTDLEIEVHKKSFLAGVDDFNFTIYARRLFDSLKMFVDNKPVIIEVDEHDSHIRCGKNKFKIKLSPKDLPISNFDLNELNKIVLKQKDLKEMLRNTSFAICPQGTGRPFLEGLFFEIENGLLKITGTDAHRLSSVRTVVETLEGKSEFLLTRKSVTELTKMLDNSDSEVTLYYNQKSAVFVFGGTTFYAKLIQPKFPNYEAIMPRKTENIAIVSRVDLLNQLNGLKFITAEDQRKYVKLTFDENTLALEVENSLHEKGDAEIDIEYTGSKVTSTFTQTYISEYLQSTDAEKLFVYALDEKAALMFREVKDDDMKRFIVMPIRA